MKIKIATPFAVFSSVLLVACVSGQQDVHYHSKDGGANDVALIGYESLGSLKIGQSRAEAMKAFALQPTAGKPVWWGADGCFHQSATSSNEGISIGLVSKTKTGPQTVESITVQSPCRFETKHGIGIGSSYGDVEKAYRSHINPEFTKPGEVLFAGSVYGGLSFQFQDRKVSRIYVGASAE